MRQAGNLTGDPLENWLKNFIKENLKFEDYYHSPGNIALSVLDSSQRDDHYIELDGLLLVNKTIIVFEITSQNSDIKDKVKSFTRNANLFYSSTRLNFKEKLDLFNVPESKQEIFEDIENWRYVYINTSQAHRQAGLDRSLFPDYPCIQENLFLLDFTNIDYFTSLSNLIEKYAQYEFLSNFNFPAVDLGDAQATLKEGSCLAGRYITANNIKADLVMTKFKVSELLKFSKVSRFEGIPLTFESSESAQFQRLLSKNKLNKIATDFIRNNQIVSYPNNITLVLNNECQITRSNGKAMLTIPNIYGSISVIDGQHRLFAYTSDTISEAVRNNAEIMATCIKFRDVSDANISKYAARVFCDINGKQAQVKNNLIYLIEYDVMGEKTSRALAGKILLECNKKGPLNNLFATNSLIKKNRLGNTPIAVTTIIDNDLIQLLEGKKVLSEDIITDEKFTEIFQNNRAYFDTRKYEYYNKVMTLLNQYFASVNRVYKKDWTKNTNSYMQSSKYYSALIRYWRYLIFDLETPLDEGKSKLEEQRDLIKAQLGITSNNVRIFSSDYAIIPNKKASIKDIFEYLKIN